MTTLLDNAVVYDEEAFPNAWVMTVEALNSPARMVFEVSQWRNDLPQLVEWVHTMRRIGGSMIGFNNMGYDYPMLHFILNNYATITYEDIYRKNNEIIGSFDRFAHVIWDDQHIVPQIDLYKIHHFDNNAKTTSLKALMINMRSKNVLESKIPFGTVLTEQQLRDEVIPYGFNDTGETKQFAEFSRGAIDFRLGIMSEFGTRVLNWNDTKIGEEMLIQRIGEEICYDKSSGRKVKRGTPRRSIPLRDIIFPYVGFRNPEFQRIHQFMLAQTLRPEDLTDPDAPIVTKGVFTNLHANVGGLTFHFGTGGVHASADRAVFYSDDDYAILDIDVEGLYPNVAIKNRLAPEHLGSAFVSEYAKIPEERKLHAKGTYQNGALKLAANGAWGKSNSMFSCFFDPKYAMTIPINGQLMICMLAEALVEVPTLQLIQANTDGITYRIKREYIPQAKEIERIWQEYTLLKLEEVEYKTMWIRDVNNYVALGIDGKLKQKGAYWHPDTLNWAESISNASPPCWYKDFNPVVVPMAAVAAMVHGVDPMAFIRLHTNPFDFMCRVKTTRGAKLFMGDEQVQSTSRYYVAINGRQMSKLQPPPEGYKIGMWKKAPKVTDSEYNAVMMETGGQWDGRVCTKNKSKYGDSRSMVQAGYNTVLCNHIDEFDFSNVNYDWYCNEVRKLII